MYLYLEFKKKKKKNSFRSVSPIFVDFKLSDDDQRRGGRRYHLRHFFVRLQVSLFNSLFVSREIFFFEVCLVNCLADLAKLFFFWYSLSFSHSRSLHW